MAGEKWGNTAILMDSVSGEIVGQLDFTASFGGTLVDITNKSTAGYITVLEGVKSGKMFTASGSITYNSDAQYKAVRAAHEAQTLMSLTLDYGPDAADEQIVFSSIPTEMSDNLSQTDAITTSITFNSSGAYSIGTVGP